MSIPEQTATQLGQIPTNKNTEAEQPVFTLRQQQKQDAMDLAELIYSIFKESESNANIGGQKRKDNKNV